MLAMLLFVVTPGYRRHFRPRRANDTIPIRPLVDILLYWLCSAFGGFFGSVGIVAMIAHVFADVQYDRADLIVIAIMTALAPPLFVVAYRSWRKLNH